MIVAAVVLASGCAWRYVYRAPHNQDEVLYCKTADGWDIAVLHYKPKEVHPEYYPLLLCHGLGDSNYVWDVHKDYSFADYLRDRGYDVWVMSFRGSGKSMKPGLLGLSKVLEFKLPQEERLTYDPAKVNWNIEDFVDKDTPAAIALIKQKTGRDKVVFMGHSLGALVNVAYLEKYGDTDVHAFVGVGLPIVFTHPLNAILREVEKNKWIVKASLFVNLRAGALWGAPVAGQFDAESDVLSFNRENMTTEVIANYLSNDIEDISTGIVDQYLEIISTGQCFSADKKYNYTDHLDKVKVPTLLVAGKVDNIATPVNVLFAFDKIGAQDKTLKFFGKQDLCQLDYGHTDLVMGKYAPAEVFPFVCEWLNDHAVTPKEKMTAVSEEVQEAKDRGHPIAKNPPPSWNWVMREDASPDGARGAAK